jgi:hypothetical protein
MKIDVDFYDDNGTNKQIRSSELQIPLTQTLITVNLKEFSAGQMSLRLQISGY